MAVNIRTYEKVNAELADAGVAVVAVSKFKSIEEIKQLYDLGQRDFGENFVQELIMKKDLLPKDIRWHFIGHLQTNKVKYIADFVYLIHSVDSMKLLLEINKQGQKINKKVDCLLQFFIADETTKYGFALNEFPPLPEINELKFANVRGVMGMATLSDDHDKVKAEFASLKALLNATNLQSSPKLFTILSMGMSSDFETAVEEGSNMVRIGSLFFGARS